MIKVNNYRIQWEYEIQVLKTNPFGKSLLEIIITNCYIYRDDVLISSEYAKLSTKDSFDKNKGRMISLRRAINALNHLEDFKRKAPIREQIWEAYRTMTKTPRWSKK